MDVQNEEQKHGWIRALRSELNNLPKDHEEFYAALVSLRHKFIAEIAVVASPTYTRLFNTSTGTLLNNLARLRATVTALIAKSY